jgi:hypothetical protein
MCTRLGFNTQLSAPNAHHMLGQTKRPWRTVGDFAFSMLYAMCVPNNMWLCAISTIVHLRNRTFSRAIGSYGGVPLTRLLGAVPYA